MKLFFIPTLVLTLAISAAPAWAENGRKEQDATPEHENFFDDFSRVSVGGAVITRPEFIGADKHETKAFPIIQGQYNFSERDAVYLRGPSLGYSHAYNRHMQVGVKTSFRASRRADDDARLSGMGDVGTAFEVGPWVKTKFYGFSLAADTLFDVTGDHDGFVANLRAGKRIAEMPGPSLEFYAETSWGSGDFMDTFFDVTAAQAQPGRPAFDADAGFYQSAVGSVFQYTLHKSVFLRLDGQLQFLHGDADDSPVTFDNTNFRGFLGLGYTF